VERGIPFPLSVPGSRGAGVQEINLALTVTHDELLGYCLNRLREVVQTTAAKVNGYKVEEAQRSEQRITRLNPTTRNPFRERTCPHSK
jgi:hypothetical protein